MTGAALLVGIVVVIAGLFAVFAFAMGGQDETTPQVSLELKPQQGGPGYRLVHEGGGSLDGNRTRIEGAVNPRALENRSFGAGDSVRVFPTRKTVRVVWRAGDGSGTVLGTFRVNASGLDVDFGCDWVDNRTDGGTGDLVVDGATVGCHVRTDGEIRLRNGAEILGRATSDGSRVVVEGGSTVRGEVTAEGVVRVDGGRVRGPVESVSAGVTLRDGTVEGSIDAAGDVVVANGSTVEGDVTSGSGAVAIRSVSYVVGGVEGEGPVTVSGSEVQQSVRSRSGPVTVDASTVWGGVNASGDVTVRTFGFVGGNVTSAGGDVSVITSDLEGSVVVESGDLELDTVTVAGEALVSGSFACSLSNVSGQNCSEYSPGTPRLAPGGVAPRVGRPGAVDSSVGSPTRAGGRVVAARAR